ncbi:MAG TPA: DUF2019 domain-containing protein [Stellaceae bacterium]|nr:DUF2019 domain-containing protein [Stellaceae bacterium]
MNLFIEKGLAKFGAREAMDIPRANKLVEDTNAIGRELASRGPEAIAALLPLLEHENDSIRMSAAAHCHAIEPERSRQVLDDISAHGDVPYRILADAQLWDLGYPSRLLGTKKPKEPNS